MKRKQAISQALRLSLALISPLAYAIYAQAQNTPDAGSIQREIERRNPEIEPPKPSVSLPALPQPVRPAAPQGVMFTPKRYVFEGNTLISTQELEKLMADTIGKPISFAQLQDELGRITSYYLDDGWYARVVVPAEQDVTDGVMRVRILEAKLGEVVMDNRSKRVDGNFVRDLVQGRQEVGKPYSATELDRGLLLANDLAGVQTTGVLEGGASASETRVLLKTEDRTRKDEDGNEYIETYSGYVNLTNYGGKSTGIPQLSAGVSPNNLLGRGDRLDVTALLSEGSRLGALGYVLPIGTRGAKLNVRGSYLQYKLISGVCACLGAKGSATNFGAGVSYPVLRSRAANFAVLVGAETRASTDQKNNTPDTHKRVNTVGFAGVGDALDSLGGGGFNQYAFGLLGGNSSTGDDNAPPSSGYSNRRYSKLTFLYSRLQRLDAGLGLFAAISGQYSKKRLDSSERFGLSGPTAIRAYNGDGGGDSGVLLTLELRKELMDGVQGVLFYDAGQVKNSDDVKYAPTGSSAGIPVTWGKTLQGTGIGLNWNKDNQWQVRASIGVPIGKNPYADANGNNADGSKKGSVRGWLQATYLY